MLFESYEKQIKFLKTTNNSITHDTFLLKLKFNKFNVASQL